MITVRSPHGLSIIYNDATFVERFSTYSDLYTDSQKSRWVAQVPNDYIIELVKPCKIEFSIPSPEKDIETILTLLERRDRGAFTYKVLIRLKKALRFYDGRRGRWK